MASSRRTGKFSQFSSNFIPEFKLQVLAVVWMYRASKVFDPISLSLNQLNFIKIKKKVMSGESGMEDQCHFLRSDELLEKERPFGKKQNAPLFLFQVFALFPLSKQLHIL